MFDKLFISVGNVVLIIYNFIINFKFPSLDFNKKEQSLAFDISQIQNIKDENNSFDEMRISFLELFITKKVVFVLSLIALILLIFL